MATKAKDNSTHWIVGIILILTGVLIIAALIVTYSQGAAVNANVNVNNLPPVIGAKAFSSSVDGAFVHGPATTLTGVVGGGNIVSFNVNVVEPNGYAFQTVTVNAKLYRTGAAPGGPTCTGDDRACLPSAGSVVCSDTLTITSINHQFTCSGLAVQYLSDPTAAGTDIDTGVDFAAEVWNAQVVANDTFGPVVDNFAAFEWPNVLGLSSPSLIALGSTDTSGASTVLAPIVITNRGNQKIDIRTQVDKVLPTAAWTCAGGGNPLISDLHHDVTGGSTTYASMDPLTNNTGFTTFNGVSSTDFNLLRAITISSPSTAPLNFRFATTEAIGPGTCTLSSIIVAAIKGY